MIKKMIMTSVCEERWDEDVNCFEGETSAEAELT